MADQAENTEATGKDAATPQRIAWVRRDDTPPFSPAPGIQMQPVIGEKMMTCWITMAPNAVVAEHSHLNEQLGVVAEGTVTLTAGGESRTVALGDAYIVPPHLPHSAVRWSRWSAAGRDLRTGARGLRAGLAGSGGSLTGMSVVALSLAPRSGTI